MDQIQQNSINRNDQRAPSPWWYLVGGGLLAPLVMFLILVFLASSNVKFFEFVMSYLFIIAPILIISGILAGRFYYVKTYHRSPPTWRAAIILIIFLFIVFLVALSLPAMFMFYNFAP